MGNVDLLVRPSVLFPGRLCALYSGNCEDDSVAQDFERDMPDGRVPDQVCDRDRGPNS